MNKYINFLPKPLLDDIIKNQCIPIIGAGFSRNADLPDNLKLPLWEDLGKYFAKQLEDYSYTTPLDAISTYTYEYSKNKTVEQLRELLYINNAKPGAVHNAFTDLPFDTIVTTNFDFLLEKAFENKSKSNCIPIIDEDQLSITTSKEFVKIIKIHGDLNHPKKLILTEEEYDTYLTNYPIMSTYISNLLITKTPLFIGYSLDDPDFRGIWQVLRSRLGVMFRKAYVLTVGIYEFQKKKYERRGVKVVNIEGRKEEYKKVLESFFKELKCYWDSKISEISTFTDVKSKIEISLPPETKTGLCYFAIPFNLLSFYRENIFPIFNEYGFNPITASDMILPGGSFMQKITTLIERADLVYVDASTPNTLIEFGFANTMGKKILLVVEEEREIPSDLRDFLYLKRPKINSENINNFLIDLGKQVADFSVKLIPPLFEEPERLLKKGEYRASVIVAFSLLENEFRKRKKFTIDKERRFINLTDIMKEAVGLHLISKKDALEWIKERNWLVHLGKRISKKKAFEIVNGILRIVNSLKTDLY